MSEQTVEKQQWGSAFGFIMTSIGYAVGVGAIWKFPYMIGMNGGGMFLLVCILMGIFICIPLAWAELTLGRYTQTSAIVGMRQLAGKGSPWVLFGWFGFAACFTMISYYITIVGDVLFYIFKFVTGGLAGMSIEEMSAYYNSVNTNMGIKIGMAALMFIVTAAVLWFGVQKGLEAANKILIPMLFIFLVILGIRGLMLPGGMEGITWLFTPDFSLLSPELLIAALNQCFFLAGVGLASLFSFGGYLDPKDSDIPFSGTVIIMSNFVVAVLAGVAIFPALFSYDMDIAQGTGLVFQTLPYVFNDMSMGTLWGALFFLLLFAAGWSSVLGLMEGSVSAISDAFKMTRKKTLLILSVLCFILSFPTIFSTTYWVDIRPLNMDLYTFMDFLAICIFCPLSGIFLAVYTTFKFPFSKFVAESSVGAKYFHVPGILKYWLGIVLPVITLILILTGIGSYTGLW